MPDATTMLVDAGPGGDAIASYIERALAPAPARLDYAVLTHFHSDHVGGIAEVQARAPIARLIDRGDRYLRPAEGDPTYAQFRRFVASRGIAREAIRIGRADQITARQVEIRAIAANGDVWTGRGDETARIFPPPESLLPEDRPSENMCSIGLRIRPYSSF